MVTLECPVCGNIMNQSDLRCKDHSVSGEMFEIYNCSQCLYAATSPQPSASEIGKYYATEEYVSHSDTTEGIVNKLYHQIRKYNTKNKVSHVNKSAKEQGLILDMGCGTGYFLSIAKQCGWRVEGVEVSDIARSHAEQRIGQKINTSLEALLTEEQRFDAITLWHVFEHLDDINTSFDQLKQLLKPQGVLIFALPNPASFDAQHYQQYWAAYDVPRHLSHFKPETIKQLSQKHGMKVTSIKPMRFDAFYISMLSEKLKGSGKLSVLLKGFWNGLRSNCKAGKTRDYSSVIYTISL